MALEPEAGPMATDTYIQTETERQTETEKKENGQQTTCTDSVWTAAVRI